MLSRIAGSSFWSSGGIKVFTDLPIISSAAARDLISRNARHSSDAPPLEVLELLNDRVSYFLTAKQWAVNFDNNREAVSYTHLTLPTTPYV